MQSMTAFARLETQADWGHVVWECRSVNHRYLEHGFRLPEQFRQLEPKLRERIRQRLQRGKLDITMRYTPGPAAAVNLMVNEPLARELVAAQQQMATITGDSVQLRNIDVLRFQGVVSVQETHDDRVDEAVLALFEQTLDELQTQRQREGNAIADMLQQRLQAIDSELDKVRPLVAAITDKQSQRIKQRFTELELAVDPSRLEQELVFLAQKADVAEELDRLDTHVREIRRIIANEAVCGRRLDFLMQELNREANTLASKSIQADTTQSSVELKVIIEQMREQIQNRE